MIRVNRWLLSILAVLYSLLHAVIGSFWVAQYHESFTAIFAIVLYLIVTLTTIGLYRGTRLPSLHAWTAVLLGLLVPLLAQSQLDSSHFGDYSTWYVNGIGTLLAVIAIREHVLLALVGVALESVIVASWAGWNNFFATGLLGPIMIVAGAAVVTVGLRRASDETKRYSDQTTLAMAEAAALQAAGEQRARLLRLTLDKALPMLRRIAQPIELTQEEKFEARLLEAALRDEIRGKGLIGDVTRAAIDRARRRGVSVSVLDEGGVENLEADELERLHARLAGELDRLASGRVTIRSPREEEWLLTIAAFGDDSNVPSLWLRLSRGELND
ncbi:MAG: hypothetical protein KGL41_01055 [Actinomycetales bacterium]|nr:hypothetical protein [Actinomycetales bacterium]